MRALTIFFIAVLVTAAPLGAEPLTYKDSRGNAVVFPQGGASFADEVVVYRPGKPAPRKDVMVTARVLGAPDYGRGGGKRKQYLCLGQGGSVTIRFTDNVLVDVPGADLYVFEIGPNVEATFVEISADGAQWLAVGRVAGSVSSLDIGPHVKPGQMFRYVRLTDDPSQGDKGGRTPGADIDAVGAIGSGQRVELPAAVLFDFDSATLKPAAAPLLDDLAAKVRAMPGASVTVEGHTDNRGSDAYNRTLSLRRAQAVSKFLEGKGVPLAAIRVEGYGASRPLASNDTEKGRSQNRRVEVLILAR